MFIEIEEIVIKRPTIEKLKDRIKPKLIRVDSIKVVSPDKEGSKIDLYGYHKINCNQSYATLCKMLREYSATQRFQTYREYFDKDRIVNECAKSIKEDVEKFNDKSNTNTNE